ncbi:MAG: glycerophosphodiester phosphodiesterase family protein [Verrucomicrobiota bacterium]
MSRPLLAIIGLSLLASVGMPAADVRSVENGSEPRAAERLLAERRPLVIGHRGYPALAPENTLPSFQLALTAGADLVELDYHHARDGTLVVIHDHELDRTTSAVERWQAKKIRVDGRTWEELRALDAGQWFSPQFTGTRLPLLTEALDLIQQQGVTLIERKAGDAATCHRLLRERDLINRVIVQSFDWAYLKDFNRQEPRQILGALGPPGSRNGQKLTDEEKTLTPKWVDEVLKTGSRAVVWNNQTTRDAVDYAHARGLKVWVYTINEPDLANALLDQGIDGIITDNTSLIWRTLALRRRP